MRESKADLTQRLRRDGRWEAFKKRREELKAGGMAASEAWGQTATEFPPLDSQRPGGAIPPAYLSALRGKPSVPIRQAVAWVFDQLDVEWITPADAPSAGAWSLLEWARSSMAVRGEFYRRFGAKLLSDPLATAPTPCREGPDSSSEVQRALSELLVTSARKSGIRPDPASEPHSPSRHGWGVSRGR